MIFDWIVVGAGPAGIAAVGKLLDRGVDPQKIGWVDPHFQVGDLGQKWRQVPSNTIAKLFLLFLHECKSFEFKDRPTPFAIEKQDPQQTCLLDCIADPLQWVTDRLKKKVVAIQDAVISLKLVDGQWKMAGQKQQFAAKNGILAIGSDPKNLTHAGPEWISLDIGLNPEKLAQAIHPQDTVAVFGSSHSAILVLANALQLRPKKVINFYRSPHRYAIDLKDWILFDDSGLKGFSASWAKEHIDKKYPPHFERVLVSHHLFEESLNLCTKAISAVGFERRKLPVLEQYERLHYDDRTGIIAPGLFGIGIAFPQAKWDPLGHLEFRVGLWKFMDFLNTALPLWIKYANHI